MGRSDDRTSRRAVQLDRLASLLGRVGSNPFYARKFDPPTSLTWDAYRRLPFTTKAELAADQTAHPPYGSNFSAPPERYVRLHQTSGTSSGRPLRWLDTRDSWHWLVGCWQKGFTELVDLRANDRVFFPFSFGPFLGFWAAFEAVTAGGLMALPAGGMPTTARLKYLLEHRATVVCGTPTYALHLAEVAAAERIDLASSSVRAVVVAGEPGGSIPATRQRIEAAFGARVFDHYGLSEVGPVAFEAVDTPNRMRVLESEFVVEVLDPDGDREVAAGEVGELVVTNLGRLDSPLIRYRTGDLVRPCYDDRGLLLDGGVLGRADDMIHVRGNNLYPSAIEGVLRRFPDVAEFRLIVDRSGPLTDLRIEVEPTPTAAADKLCEAIARAVRDELLFRPAVVAVPAGTLPRFELKAKRIVLV